MVSDLQEVGARIERLTTEIGRHAERVAPHLFTIGAVLRGEEHANPARVLERLADCERQGSLLARLVKLETALRRLRKNVESHRISSVGGLRVLSSGMSVSLLGDAVAKFRDAITLPEVERELTPGMCAIVAAVGRVEAYLRRPAAVRSALAKTNAIDTEGTTIEGGR